MTAMSLSLSTPTTLAVEDAAIVESDAHLRSAVDHVVVGDDIAVGRNDDAAADAVLKLRLRFHALHAAHATWAEEELAESGR